MRFVSRFSDYRLGESFAMAYAFLGSLTPVLAALSFQAVSPLQSAAVTTGISAFVFAAIASFRREWQWRIPVTCARDIAIAGMAIGFVFYGLFFVGLKHTTPGNAAIIGLMEVFFCYLFLNVLTRHESLSTSHVLGSILMVAGAAIVLLPGFSDWKSGDILVLLASAVPPFANAAQQRARRHVSASFLLFWRSVIATVALFMLAHFLDGPLPTSVDTRTVSILLLNGIFAFGLAKVFWIEAIHRIPITKTIAFSCIQPLLTILFAYLFLRQSATVVQLLSFVPMAAGMFLLMRSPGTEIPQSTSSPVSH
ncbi:MAG: DMT family transporter [Candidatus Peribacteraceae bacterium]|nr:DMT family transporter [Candidatus Peribacteraceae bacterium]